MIFAAYCLVGPDRLAVVVDPHIAFLIVKSDLYVSCSYSGSACEILKPLLAKPEWEWGPFFEQVHPSAVAALSNSFW